MAGPAYHGRTHIPAGTDPIPGLLDATGATTYPELVLDHPCLVHYWPADEASGNLIDRVGSWDLVPDTASVVSAPYTPGTYPQYGATGPLTELPEYTAVTNAGDPGIPSAADGRFEYVFGTPPAFWSGTAAFTIEAWFYLIDYGTGGTRTFFQVAGTAGDTLQFDLFASAGTLDQLQFGRGGLSILDPDEFPLEQWQHVAARYDGSTLDLIRNATIVASASTSASMGFEDTVTWLNKTEGPSWAPFYGHSAHLAIYDCALSDADIADHVDAVAASGAVSVGYVPTSDGEGGYDWAPPTIEVEF